MFASCSAMGSAAFAAGAGAEAGALGFFREGAFANVGVAAGAAGFASVGVTLCVAWGAAGAAAGVLGLGAAAGAGEAAPVGIFRLGIFSEGFAGSAVSVAVGADGAADSAYFRVTVPLLSGSAGG